MASQCGNCKQTLSGSFCSNCGQPAKTGRITLHSLWHEIFHTFTHLDKGYGHSVKMLIKSPGEMQRRYLEGERIGYQKPFSYFFVNATISALVAYWVSVLITRIYGETNVSEEHFFKSYFAITQVILLPFYAFTSYLVWKLLIKSKYNYGEMLVLILYSAGMFMLFLAMIYLTKLIFRDMNTRYFELILLLPYNVITNHNFFRKNWPIIIVGTTITFAMNYLLSSLAQDLFIHQLK